MSVDVFSVTILKNGGHLEKRVISLVFWDKFIPMTLRYFHTKAHLCVMIFTKRPFFDFISYTNLKKKTQYLVNGESDQNSLNVKKMRILISFPGVLSNLMYLQSIQFYYSSKNITQKLKNPIISYMVNLIKKSA